MSKTKSEISIDWVDSNTKILDQDGQVSPAGTAVLINNNIIFLSPLSTEQLQKLKDIVTQAVDHELSKR